ncbi:lantibiotic dehydratase [Lentzea sp. NBRC 105346]|uniref:lantibiotic dehydratase n=1 Tax=Lentzea sp. NBRC 105346 TaxID=3032205 RepID=UPI0024A44673|nr:lantibiotic dehydratase [Lentzea sp. NBRC 105346]GLZ35617.1 lantibiotic dehydratase [Lentzea sp. NBRC 105346]
MPGQGLFTVARLALLRAATMPSATAEDTWTDLDLSDSAAVREYVSRLVADPVVREAVAVSSASLAHGIDALEAGAEPGQARLRRLATALTRYRLRMASRPTPYGLLAGVAVADTSGTEAKTRLGRDHRRSVRADHGWLTAVLRRWEQDPAVLPHLSLVANDLAFLRGDRLVLPFAPQDAEGAEERPDELSVRHTPVVAEVLARASRPIRFPDLVDGVCSTFAGAPRDRVEGLVRGLVAQRILLTDLRPPAHAPDPVRHVLDLLGNTGLPDVAELRDAHRLAAEYARQPLGHGLPAWRAATTAMKRLHPDGEQLHVDLVLDADVRLPRAVAEEAESAASVLWRLTPEVSRHHHLDEFLRDFVERYGLGRLVPVKELLDPQRGLGAPAGYRVPVSTRTPGPPPEQNDDRLFALAHRAAWSRQREIVLDEDLIAHLAPERPAAPHESLDFSATVVASSAEALRAGDFRLVTPIIGGGSGGAVTGRFAYLFDDLTEQLAEIADGDVQLTFETGSTRLANVAQVPSVAERRIGAGVFTDRGAPGVLGLDDLAVAATPDGLHLYSLSLGHEIRPSTFHMVNIRTLAPNVARLLFELPRGFRTIWNPWVWGAARRLPFLPRIRHGRTVLSPARWRPDLSTSDSNWTERFRAWREEWDVPSIVQATFADQRIELNLDYDLHLHLLRDELRREPDTVLVEPPGDTGWLDGHRNEVVFTLLPTAEPERPRTLPRAPMRTADHAHLPGGDWLYAKVYAAENRHDQLITQALPELLRALPDEVDRWFFLRYRDPDPHLRLRFHGDPARLLPALHDWAAGLRRRGECGALLLDTYDPELERYGGPELIEAAERFFHADSAAAITRAKTTSPELTAAANYLDLLRSFGAEDWMTWLVTSFPKDSHHQAFQRHRAAAVRLLDQESTMDESWRDAVAEYGELFRRTESWTPRDVALSGLMHMHFNRHVGINRPLELDSLAIAAGAVRAHLDRQRAASR